VERALFLLTETPGLAQTFRAVAARKLQGVKVGLEAVGGLLDRTVFPALKVLVHLLAQTVLTLAAPLAGRYQETVT
jgi:hypothetical protein